jgi:hypothetical protein
MLPYSYATVFVLGLYARRPRLALQFCRHTPARLSQCADATSPKRVVTNGGYMMSFEEFDAIRSYDHRCGKDETVMLSVVRDRRRLIEFVEQLMERIRELEGKT